MSTCNKPLSLCKSADREQFWVDKLDDLYRDGKYLYFFPKYEMTRVEQLNALTRFFIYSVFLLLLFYKGEKWLYIPMIGILFIAIIHYFHSNDEKSREKELKRILQIRKENRDDIENYLRGEMSHDGDRSVELDIDTEELPYGLEVGTIDSDGQTNIGPKQTPTSYDKVKQDLSLFTVDEMIDYEKNTCRRPTRDNPFSNPSLYDYNNPYAPPAACNGDDDEIRDETRAAFNQDLFRDVDELFEKHNSQRQFYTLPSTGIPNNQSDFANWLYKMPDNSVCKQSGQACLKYEDLRYKR